MAVSGRYVSLGVFLLAFLLYTLSLLAPYWFHDEGPPISKDDTYSMSGYHLLYEKTYRRRSYGGLWLLCRTTAITICDTIDFDEIPWHRRAAFIWMFIALPLNVVTIGLYIRSLSKKYRLSLPASLQIVSGMCNILAVACFASSAMSSQAHWAFYMACVSGPVLLVNGLCTLFVIDRKETPQSDMTVLVDPPPYK